jgi:hypothetical protein
MPISHFVNNQHVKPINPAVEMAKTMGSVVIDQFGDECRGTKARPHSIRAVRFTTNELDSRPEMPGRSGLTFQIHRRV